MEFDSLTFLIMVIVLLAAVLASIAAWVPRKTWVRVNALVITLLIMPIGFLQVTEMLSRPKPANYEWLRRHVDKVTVLSASFRENKPLSASRGSSKPFGGEQESLEEAVHKNGNVVLRHFFSPILDDYVDLNVSHHRSRPRNRHTPRHLGSI